MALMPRERDRLAEKLKAIEALQFGAATPGDKAAYPSSAII